MSDAAMIANLVLLAFSTQSRQTNPPPGPLNKTADTIAEHLRDGGGAIVGDGGLMVGVVLWNQEESGLYISRLSVHPERRRRGIARALMEAAEHKARQRGLARLRLGVRLALEDNSRFFASAVSRKLASTATKDSASPPG